MKISSIELYGYDLRYAHGSYVMSEGRVIETLPTSLVRVRTNEGLEGWGEACPLGSTYLPSTAATVRAALAELAPQLLGHDPREVTSINDRMDAVVRGQPAAKSPLDIACWDLLGQATGLSVTTLLGGRRSESFALYVAVPLGTADAMTEHVRARRAEGIHRFQLKLGGDPREDAARVRAVLAATGDEDLIIADANGGWRRQDAIVALRLLDRLDRVVLEQPCPTLTECLAVARHTTLPLVLDEVIVDMEALMQIAGRDGAAAFNLKLGRVGGLTRARAMRDAAEQLGLRITIEDTWGGDLVTAAVSHLAASTAPEALLNVSFMNDWVLDHVAGYEPRSKHGRGSAPERPGLGVDVDIDMLGQPLAVFS